MRPKRKKNVSECVISPEKRAGAYCEMRRVPTQRQTMGQRSSLMTASLVTRPKTEEKKPNLALARPYA
jgi:hypothetical protein